MNGFIANKGNTRYHKIDQIDDENSSGKHGNHIFNFQNHHQMQQKRIEDQDEKLDKIGGSIKVLKDMSHSIGQELDNQSVILDEFSKDLDHTESRMDTVMKKMAKTMRMSSDRRQWMAIVVLSIIIFILFILFFI